MEADYPLLQESVTVLCYTCINWVNTAEKYKNLSHNQLHYIVGNYNEAMTSNPVAGMGQLELGDAGEEDQVEMSYNSDASSRHQSPEQTFNTQIALGGGQNYMEYNSQASCLPSQTTLIQNGNTNIVNYKVYAGLGAKCIVFDQQDKTVTRIDEQGESKSILNNSLII